MSFPKTVEEINNHHQYQHKMLALALPVQVERDINGHALSYADNFGEKGNIEYHLFNGHAEGEGHADRILDHYLCCVKQGIPLTCHFSEECRSFLRNERLHGAVAPPQTLRARLLRVA